MAAVGVAGVKRKSSYTLHERALIRFKWLASGITRGRRFEDYPTRIRLNGDGSDPDQAYFAQILNWPGPIGLGGTPEEASASLRENLESVRRHTRSQHEDMPRPGSRVPLRFVPTLRVATDPSLLDEFIEKVLGFPPGAPVFVSDGSRLSDFGDDEHERQLRNRIQQIFGVDVSDLEGGVVSDILERIQARSDASRVELGFGDHVRVLADPATEEAGLSGLVGQIYGITTPSMTGLAVVGNLYEDRAFAIQFDGREEAVWLVRQLVEFVDHGPGTDIGVGDRRWVRNADGEWIERAAIKDGPRRARR